MENIHFYCRAHNRHHAEEFYGPGRMRGGIDPVRDGIVVGRDVERKRLSEVTRSGTGALPAEAMTSGRDPGTTSTRDLFAPNSE